MATDLYQDGVGVYFNEIRQWLPSKVRDWPQVRIVDSTGNRSQILSRGFCFMCGASSRWHGPLEVHHIFGGSRGRCDSLTNLMPVCRACHEETQSVPAMLPKVLLAKWKHDRANVSWVRLVVLNQRWFPFDSLEA